MSAASHDVTATIRIQFYKRACDSGGATCSSGDAITNARALLPFAENAWTTNANTRGGRRFTPRPNRTAERGRRRLDCTGNPDTVGDLVR